uniref:Uncharacterized protein n=1 Tax=Hyaloperonospora arabidopsidis (strain Emoy2) TaxID=559515 RepID=M4BSP7_HYAAE
MARKRRTGSHRSTAFAHREETDFADAIAQGDPGASDAGVSGPILHQAAVETSLLSPAFQLGAASGVSSDAPLVTAESCLRSPPVPDPTWSKAGVSSLFARKYPVPSMGGIFCQTSEEGLLALTAAQADANAAAASNTSKYRLEYECAHQDCWRLLEGKQRTRTALEKETYRLWLVKAMYLVFPPVFYLRNSDAARTELRRIKQFQVVDCVIGSTPTYLEATLCTSSKLRIRSVMRCTRRMQTTAS